MAVREKVGTLEIFKIWCYRKVLTVHCTDKLRNTQVVLRQRVFIFIDETQTGQNTLNQCGNNSNSN